MDVAKLINVSHTDLELENMSKERIDMSDTNSMPGRDIVFDWNFTGNNSHWDSVYLWDTKYYCPECKTIDMRFIHGGIMWD